MKRIALLILAALPAWAAGSCTVSAPVQFAASASWMVSVACTGDASTGSFPAVNLKALQPLLGGYISRVETVPGTTAPTANYTMTLLDAKGGDELNGQGSGTMSATAVQIFAIGTGTPITASETLNLTGNSVASAGVTVYIYVIAANNTMAQILALGCGTSAGGGGGGGVTSVFSRTGAVTADTGDYSVGQVTGAAGINGSPTANAVVTDYSASLVQTPNASSTLDGSGNLGVGGSITSGVGCVTTACISSDTWYDSGATHATVQLGATTGYNGTNTWDGNAPTSGYFWGAYGVSGDNASVGWRAVSSSTPYSCTVTTVSSIACTHNFGIADVWVACYDGSGYLMGSNGSAASVQSVVATSTSVVTIGFSNSVSGTCLVSTGGMGPTGATGAQGPGAPTLQVNGTNNVSQTLLNLAAGAGITTVDNGSGTVTIANSRAAGSNYNGYGMWTLTVPTATGWTWANQGSATDVFGTNFVGIAAPPASGTNLRILHEACPSGFTSGTLDLYALIMGSAYQKSGSEAGIEIDDGTKVLTVTEYLATGGLSSDLIAVDEFTSVTAYNANVTTDPGYFPWIPIWYHVHDASGTLTIHYSFDGMGTPGTNGGWRLLGSTTTGGLSAVTNCGIVVAGVTSYGASVEALSFAFVASLSNQ